jgi:hypothetical protein
MLAEAVGWLTSSAVVDPSNLVFGPFLNLYGFSEYLQAIADTVA